MTETNEPKKVKTYEINGEELTAREIKAKILEQLPEITTDEAFTAMIQAVIKVSVRASGRKAESKTSLFRTMIEERGTMTEDEIWASFKWGKHEVLSACWSFRKKGNPEDFIYVEFSRNEEGTGVYTLVGKGPEAPEGFGQKK